MEEKGLAATREEVLRLIADMAEGSTTPNTLPHIAKLARGALEHRLPGAFITCNSAAPRYWVEIKTPTLKAAQEWHDAVLRLAV